MLDRLDLAEGCWDPAMGRLDSTRRRRFKTESRWDPCADLSEISCVRRSRIPQRFNSAPLLLPDCVGGECGVVQNRRF